MHVFIVYCHPSPVSFTHSLLQMFIRGLQEAGHTYEVSDLYKMNYRPDMNEAEYFRESGRDSGRSVPGDVRREQEKIGRADALVFIYPVWWSDCPAKLKGWFDRVYTLGYAYVKKDREHTTFANFARIKRALVICTAGHTVDHLEEIGIAGSMRLVMLNDRLAGIGVKNPRMLILGGTVSIGKKMEDKHLATAFQLGKEIGSSADQSPG
jgi:NAD(P)H dehydrogenase (quinone)